MEELLQRILKLYDLDLTKMTQFPTHEGGRNIVYRCGDVVIRISKNSDRTYEDFLSETEYVHFLALNGADCVDVIPSLNGKLVEQFDDVFDDNCIPTYITAFTLAKGDQIAEHGYKYRDGVPLSEYFYNTGKCLGRIHELSKNYKPKNRRFDFFEKYNEEYFDELIPSQFTQLKEALHNHLEKLRALPKTSENYGMVHFDFSDGNYNIDYATGKITVFDFENCRTCFYLYDLANLWSHGVGWIAWEKDIEKRKTFMQEYFNTVLQGYCSQTNISDDEFSLLPFMIQTVLMENIIDEFEVQKAETGTYEDDEEQSFRIKCMVENIEYMGFFLR